MWRCEKRFGLTIFILFLCLTYQKRAWYIYDQDDEGIFCLLGLIHMWRNGLIAFLSISFSYMVDLLTMGTWFCLACWFWSRYSLVYFV